MEHPLHSFGTNDALGGSLAARVAADLAAAVEARGQATLALSGGSTPRPFLEALSRQPLDWARVSVTQVDERWVDEDHPDANAGLIRAHLLRNAAAQARFISMKTPSASPFGAEAEAGAKLAAFAGRIDVVVLGMGEDGHTASFFPGAETLQRALDPAGEALCVAVHPAAAPHERMTLALPAILRARHCYLHLVGTTKLAVLQRALAPGEADELPIRAVLHSQGCALEIYHAQRS